MYKVLDLLTHSIEYFDDLVSAKEWLEFLIIQKNDKKDAIYLLLTNEENDFLKAYQLNDNRQIKSYDIDLGIDNIQTIFQQHNSKLKTKV